MMIQLPKSTATIIPLLLLTLTTATITDQELDFATTTLRSHGYTLFPNAIATSDLRILFLSSPNDSNFTLFSPPDPLLYSLDFTSPPHVYERSLMSHVSPWRLPLSVLETVSDLETLEGSRRLVVSREYNGSVLVDGVRVTYPDMFVGWGFIVHGLEGILVSSRDVGNAPANAPASDSAPASSPVPRPGRRRKIVRAFNQERVQFGKWTHRF